MGRGTVYNNFVTDEKWMKVNEENKDLMDEFLNYLSSVGRSDETIKQYNNDLKIFFIWFLDKCKNKHFSNIKKRDVVNFQGYLLNQCGMSSSRIRRMRSTLSSISNFIESVLDDEYEDFRNIINKIEAPVGEAVREKTIVTFDECIDIADKLILNDKIQVACYLMVACYSGLRKQELLRLKFDDFYNKVNMVIGENFYLTSPIKVKGRGNRTEKKYVWNRAKKYIDMWINKRIELGIECEYLFCKKTKGQYIQSTVSTADSYSRVLTKYFGIPLYTHSLRHTLATELVKSGLPKDVPQFLLSHSNSSVTDLYIDIDKSEGLNQFEDYFSGKVDSVKAKSIDDVK